MRGVEPVIVTLRRGGSRAGAATSPTAAPAGPVGDARAPDPDGAWTDIEEFALTCVPESGVAEVAAHASRARRRWARYGELPDDTSDLRACLFFEQRRWNLFGGEPEGRARAYAAALVRAIATASAGPAAASDRDHTEGRGTEGDDEVAEAG
jgi:hypothetical protein